MFNTYYHGKGLTRESVLKERKHTSFTKKFCESVFINEHEKKFYEKKFCEKCFKKNVLIISSRTIIEVLTTP